MKFPYRIVGTMADTSDDELVGPQLPQMPSASAAAAGVGNPFSPQSAGAAPGPTNEARLMQLLETMSSVLTHQVTESARSSSSSNTLRGRDLAKVIKSPEPFSSKDRDGELAQWTSWSWELEQWLNCLDKGFSTDISSLRVHATSPVNMSTLDEATADRSRLLYSVLAGLLQANVEIHQPSEWI